MQDLYAQAQGAQMQAPQPGIPGQGAKNPMEIKQQILTMLEQKGVFNEIAPKDKENILLEVDKLVQAITSQNQQAIQTSPIMQLISASPQGGM